MHLGRVVHHRRTVVLGAAEADHKATRIRAELLLARTEATATELEGSTEVARAVEGKLVVEDIEVAEAAHTMAEPQGMAVHKVVGERRNQAGDKLLEEVGGT